METTTSQRGVLNPEEAARHFRLTRYAPSPDLAHLVERFWFVEWDLREPFTQELITHPCVNLVFEDRVALIHGVVTGRERARLQHEANQQSRRIYRQKHDAQDRG